MYGEIDLHAPDAITEFRDGTSAVFTALRDSHFPVFRENAGMTNALSDQRRAAFIAMLDRLVSEGVVANLNDWAKKAGIRESTIGDFVRERTGVPSDRTYRRLAAAVGRPVWELKGEAPPLSETQRRALAALDLMPADVQEAQLETLEALARHFRGTARQEPPGS